MNSATARHSNCPGSHSPLAAAAIAASVLSGCAVGPDYTPPDPGPLPGPPSPSLVAAMENAPDSLAALLELATTNNLSVLQAIQRVEASRAALAASRAEFWPSVGFSAGTSKSRSKNPSSSSERSSLGFDASWELDLFGKVRRSNEAAAAELAAAEFSLADALVTLKAEVSAEYVNLCLQRKIASIVRRNIETQRELAEIAKSKYDAGLATELDWLSAKSQLHSVEASLPSAEASAAGCLHRIELLCGLPPGALPPGSIPDYDFASATQEETPETRSDLLRNRPDVRKAERAYAAALARVGVAKANYYPSVSIGAGLSLASDAFADWGDAVRTVSFGPSLNWNILSFGRTSAKVAQARAAAEEAALAYREAVLGAYHEVEDATVELARDIARTKPLEEAYAAQKEADKLAEKLYREDLGEYRDVLTSRQSLLSQERSLAELRANLILSRIALDKALAR